MTGEDGVMTEAPDAMVPMAVQNNLLEGRKLLESMEPQQRLAWGLDQFGDRFALTTRPLVPAAASTRRTVQPLLTAV